MRGMKWRSQSIFFKRKINVQFRLAVSTRCVSAGLGGGGIYIGGPRGQHTPDPASSCGESISNAEGSGSSSWRFRKEPGCPPMMSGVLRVELRPAPLQELIYRSPDPQRLRMWPYLEIRSLQMQPIVKKRSRWSKVGPDPT